MNEADLEYGPTPADAEHEHTDIEPSIAWKFAIWLAVAMVISAAIVYGTFWFFEARSETAAARAEVSARGRARSRAAGAAPADAAVQGHLPAAAAQARKLTSYGWVDQGAGVVHIPIDEAMRLWASAARSVAAGSAGGLNQVVQDRRPDGRRRRGTVERHGTTAGRQDRPGTDMTNIARHICT